MEVKITPSQIGGCIHAINSKSHVHRLLICAALSKKPVTIYCPDTSNDIEATARCLCALGASIKRIDKCYEITPAESIPSDPLLNCSDSGSTLRFLLPVAAALGADARFYMTGRLPERPITPLTDQLIAHGCRVKKDTANILHCASQLTPGEYSLPGNISSQYFSGLLFALPLLNGDSVIHIEGDLESVGYIQMTLDALNQSGINIIFEGDKFIVPGNQTYSLPEYVKSEGDWSNAAFWLSMGALSKKSVICTGLNHKSSQKDKRIVRILRRFGATVTTTPDTVTVSFEKLHGIVINAADIPDIVPVLAVVAASAEGTTKFTHASRLRMKESDRLRSVTEMLKALGADITEYSDKLVINGSGTLKGGVVDSCGDHRIAMSAACASVICTDTVTVKGAQCVSKSYPAFWDDFEMMGGKIERQDTV